MSNPEIKSNGVFSPQESFAELGVNLEVELEKRESVELVIGIGILQNYGINSANQSHRVDCDISQKEKKDMGLYSIDRLMYNQAKWWIDFVCSYPGISEKFRKTTEDVFNWMEEDLGSRLTFLRKQMEEIKKIDKRNHEKLYSGKKRLESLFRL